MKKLFLCFFGAVFCTANVLGADSSSVSRISPTNNPIERVENAENVRSARKTANVESGATRTTTRNKKSNVQTRDLQKNANVVSRSVNNQKTNARTAVGENVNVVSRAHNENPKRAGVVSRVASANTRSVSNEQNRGIQSRASIFSSKKTVTPTAESISAAKDILEKTADLNNTCQQQYNECMDQFCMVVDANQKRCSCSANLAKYEKVQKAVENANAELNEVAQNIRYVGLSANEIRAIMSATEAEEAMSKTKDNTETRSMLDDIADMIKDPSTSTTSDYSVDASGIMDLDFDLSGDSDNLFDLFGNSNDISNKRGRDLYKEATKRCKSVLNACKDAGGTESQITGNYDLAIDKDCIAYEQGLEKLNDTLVANVRSANLMLQKARLAVLQNKNQYDTKGCIGALEECMLDDMVCGADYVKCLDPTKQYIDENGSVVLGRNITNITAFMENYDNSKIDEGFIKNSSTDTACVEGDGKCIVNYLMSKIGTGATVQDGGLCRAVLDKCQDYTYVKNNKSSTYNPYNDVVVNYVKRAMVNIKAAQSRIISDYAKTCMADIADCYNQQYTQINSWTSSASVDGIYKVLTGACYNVALTCGYAVFAYDQDMGNRVDEIKNSGKENGESDTVIKSKQNQTLIQGVSALFYQSLLCPDNSVYTSVTKDSSTAARFANDRCVCNNGYKVSGTSCVACENGEDCTNPDGLISSYSPSSNQSSNSGSSSDDSDSPSVPETQDTPISCPANATPDDGANSIPTVDRARNGYVNVNCKCNSGYKVNNGSCVSTCPQGYYTYELSCVQSCPNDYYVNGSRCITKSECQSKAFYLFGDNCVESCPSPSTVNYIDSGGFEACKCADGYEMSDGVCELNCTDGYLISGECHRIKNETYSCYGYKSPDGDSNYGTGSCSMALAGNGNWKVQYSNKTYAGGSACSESSSQNLDDEGRYCFCNLNQHGYVYRSDSGDGSSCMENCAWECVKPFVNQTSELETYLNQLYN